MFFVASMCARHRSAAGDTPDHGAVYGARRPRQHCAMNRPRTPDPAPRASAQEKNACPAARATLQALATLSASATRWPQTTFLADAARGPGPIRTNSVSLCPTLSHLVSPYLTSHLTLSHLASRLVSAYLTKNWSCLTEIRCWHSRAFIMFRRGRSRTWPPRRHRAGDRHGAMPRLR